LVLALFIVSPGQATGFVQPQQQPVDEDDTVTASIEKRTTAAVHARLTQVHDLQASWKLDKAGGKSEASASEMGEYSHLLNQLNNVYESHLDSLKKLHETQSSRHDFQHKMATWLGFSESGPYSVDFVDGLWTKLRAKDHEIKAARLEQAMFVGLFENHRLALDNSGQALRKSVEQLETANSAQSGRLRWLRDLSKLRNLYDQAQVGMLDTEGEIRDETLGFRIDEQKLLQRQVMTASQVSPLSKEDHGEKVALLVQSQHDLKKEIQQANKLGKAAQTSLNKTQDRLHIAHERLINSVTDISTVEEKVIQRLQQKLDTQMAESGASISSLKALHLLAQVLAGHLYAWDVRYEIEHTEDSASIDKALLEIQQGLKRLALWRPYLQSDLQTTRLNLGIQEKRLANWKPENGDRTLAKREQHAYARLEVMLQRVVNAADDLHGMVSNLQESAQWRQDDATFTERLRGLYSRIGTLAVTLWNFELFTVNDNFVSEGMTIVSMRRVTVGKIIVVILILVVGLWLTARISDFCHRLIIRWLPRWESAGLLGLRLFTLLAMVGIVVFALISVHIPLTVFTFLGGALAIGAGFGAQNILNNFISGLILLVERPIKLDDMVEVDGILGLVKVIGSRCCQVRRLDGIDMLIPNSSFLEKNVTNWTHSDHLLRLEVDVGIAYGSPLSKAKVLIERAAVEHPYVLKAPKPKVYLEDFASDALNLTLLFWIDLSSQSDRRLVMSDIRYRIEALFGENGIVIAFPQRDVHLESALPIKVEIIAPEAGRQDVV